MKKLKKILYRCFPVFVCISIIFSFTTYASAAYISVNYQDFVEDVTYDSDGKIVHCKIPTTYNYLQLTQFGKNKKYEYATNDFVIPFSLLETNMEQTQYNFTVVSLPLGSRTLELENFPRDTEFTFSYRIEEHRMNGIQHMHLVVDFQWFDKDSNYLGYTTAYTEHRNGDDSKIFNITTKLAMTAPANVAYVRFRVALDIGANADVTQTVKSFSIYPGALYLDIPLSSLLVEEEQNEKIIGELEKLNNYNKDLINGTPSQNQQVQNDVNKLENSSDKLNDLTDQMVVSKPSIDPGDVAVENLADPSDISLMNMPLTILWENPTILAMVTIIFTLILVSWVFFGKK